MRRRDKEAGFTLVELLVSLMVLSLVMSFVPGALRSGQRIWEMERRLDEEAALSSFRRYVEQRLAEAMPLQSRLPGRGVLLEFTGEPDRIAFIAPAASGPGGGGVYRFELKLEPGAGRSTLILRQSIYRRPQPKALQATSDTPPPMAMERRLHGGIDGLALSYYGAPEQDQPATWSDRWTRSDRLPDLVEIRFTIPGGQAERMVVPLRLGQTS